MERKTVEKNVAYMIETGVNGGNFVGSAPGIHLQTPVRKTMKRG
jgi:hypothetical protein